MKREQGTYSLSELEMRKVGREPEARDESSETGIPATLAVAMTDKGGLSAGNESLTFMVSRLYSVNNSWRWLVKKKRRLRET